MRYTEYKEVDVWSTQGHIFAKDRASFEEKRLLSAIVVNDRHKKKLNCWEKPKWKYLWKNKQLNNKVVLKKGGKQRIDKEIES